MVLNVFLSLNLLVALSDWSEGVGMISVDYKQVVDRGDSKVGVLSSYYIVMGEGLLMDSMG